MDGRENRSGLSRVDGEDLDSYMRRLDEYIQRLDWQSEGHRQWYTHKNPYGCWICDVFFIIGQIRDVLSHECTTAEDKKPDYPRPDSKIVDTGKRTNI